MSDIPLWRKKNYKEVQYTRSRKMKGQNVYESQPNTTQLGPRPPQSWSF